MVMCTYMHVNTRTHVHTATHVCAHTHTQACMRPSTFVTYCQQLTEVRCPLHHSPTVSSTQTGTESQLDCLDGTEHVEQSVTSANMHKLYSFIDSFSKHCAWVDKIKEMETRQD